MNESTARLFLLLNLASTLFMVGLIWFVQVVHYPLFAKTGAAEFSTYEKAHANLTSFVVGPPMFVELGTALLLVRFKPTGIFEVQCAGGLVLVGVIWLSTLVLQVPCHNRLAICFDPKIHGKLVFTNWLRTVAWSARGVLVCWMMWMLLR